MISGDVRAAAQLLLQADFDFNDEAASNAEALAAILRAHADLLERMEGQMRDNVAKRFAQWTLTKRWADAISTGSLE